MMIKEIDKETFFKYLTEVNDCPYQVVGASDFYPGKNPETNDDELTLKELQGWEDCEYFVEIEDNAIDVLHSHFYIIRSKVEPEIMWYAFEGSGWMPHHSIENKWNEWPNSLTCGMYGGWCNVRYTEIYKGYGFDSRKPFVDLIHHFENLRDIFKMKKIGMGW